MTVSVAVVQGGPSSEAAVSRVSAAGVAAALEKRGFRVVRLELDSSLPSRLASERFDVVFPVTHGAIGEDGCLQGLLELLGFAYVGSGVLASALASDKIVAKKLFEREGLPLATDAVVLASQDLQKAAAHVRRQLGPAVVVKPHAQGSAIGVTRVPSSAPDADLVAALQKALAIDSAALCERFVMGREVTCGVVDAAPLGAARALPPTEILAKLADYYDFASRYAPGGSEHRCPADLPRSVTERVQDIAFRAHRALGCRDLSRVDFVVGDEDDPSAVTLLEVNTMPGMTPTSLYPEACAKAGIDMETLCEGLVRSALARGPRTLPREVPMP